jgi:hypothetical protein
LYFQILDLTTSSGSSERILKSAKHRVYIGADCLIDRNLVTLAWPGFTLKFVAVKEWGTDNFMPKLLATYSSFLNQEIKTGLTVTISPSKFSIVQMSKLKFFDFQIYIHYNIVGRIRNFLKLNLVVHKVTFRL